MQDSMLVLAVHGGDTKYAVDTAFLDKNGWATFSKKTPLEGGMYFLVLNGKALFDFLVSADGSDFFKIITEKDNYSKVEFENSPENNAMLAYIDFRNKHQQKYNKLIDEIRAGDENSDEQKQRRAQLLDFNIPLINFSDSIAAKYKGKFIATVVKALEPLEEPKIDIPADAPEHDRKVAMAIYLYQKNHFFDNVDLNDERLLRTPFFEKNIFDYYFDHVLVFRESDSIIPPIDMVMNKIKVGSKTYRYLLSHLFNKYMQSKIMGQEKIAIHLGENYYLTDKVNWETEKFEKELIDFILHNRPTLIGETSPNLVLPTPDGNRYESIHGLTSKYVVLYFFDPDCSTCKKDTPLMLDLYHKYKDTLGVEFYAVNIMTDKDKWLKFINEYKLDWINVWDPSHLANIHNLFNTYTTPQIYLLDKDKKVLARRLDPTNLEKILKLFLSKKEE
jgi:thiol-disulfide isomerase/thioredoxin